MSAAVRVRSDSALTRDARSATPTSPARVPCAASTGAARWRSFSPSAVRGTLTGTAAASSLDASPFPICAAVARGLSSLLSAMSAGRNACGAGPETGRCTHFGRRARSFSLELFGSSACQRWHLLRRPVRRSSPRAAGDGGSPLPTPSGGCAACVRRVCGEVRRRSPRREWLCRRRRAQKALKSRRSQGRQATEAVEERGKENGA